MAHSNTTKESVLSTVDEPARAVQQKWQREFTPPSDEGLEPAHSPAAAAGSLAISWLSARWAEVAVAVGLYRQAGNP